MLKHWAVNTQNAKFIWNKTTQCPKQEKPLTAA